MTETITNREMPVPPVDRNEWLKSARPEGIDPEKFILGAALYNISGDDGQVFFWYFADPENKGLYRKAAPKMREEYMMRLSGEIATPELPSEIRAKLETIRDEVAPADWTNKDNFLGAYNRWNALKTEVKGLINGNQRFKDAVRYHREMLNEVNGLYLKSGDDSLAA